MAFRRRLAERISKVKERTGLKTPVLDEVPLKAKSISQEAYLQLDRLRGVRDRELSELLERLKLPTIVRGKAYGETAGRWYKVTFPHPVYDANVVAVAEGRKGDRPRSKRIERIEELVDIPSIPELRDVLKEHIPDLTIPRWSIQIPTAQDFKDLVKDFLGDWGTFNFIRDWIADGFGGFEYWIWDKLFRPRALQKLNDQVLVPLQNSLNSRLTQIRGVFNTKLSAIDDRIETFRTRANTRITDANNRIETMRVRANDAFKTLFPRLYDAWGQRRDMILTVAQIRNVTNTGFEFLSMGETTVHYIAMGKRR